MPTAAFRVSVSNTAGCIFWYRGDTVKKRVFYTELSYLVGIAVIALGTALTAWGDFGISMVVAPAFVLHLKMSQVWPWFTFGVAEYVLQAFVLLLMMCLLRRIKISYFLSFFTAIFYGLVLDAGTALLSLLSAPVLWQRLTAYIVGDLGICAGVALVFHTYLPPEAYELFVMELSGKLRIRLAVFKTCYDCASLVVAVVMSFLLLGSLQGVGVGTVVCALINGTLINLFSQLYERIWKFEDKFALRGKLQESEEHNEQKI